MHAKSREEAEKLYEEKEEVHVRDGVREFGEERRKWGWREEPETAVVR